MSLTVNGQVIPKRLIADEMERMRPEYERTFADLSAAERETQLCAWATENLIERVVLHQHAREADIEIADEAVDAAVAQLREVHADAEALHAVLDCQDEQGVRDYALTSLKAQQILHGIRQHVTAPAEGETEAYYEAHRDDYYLPERVHAAHIVIQLDGHGDEAAARARLQEAQAALQDGKPFHLVAETYSDCPERGGDMGFFARGRMVEEFEDVVFNLGPGEVSDIFRTRFGLHLATVYQREPATPLPLKDVRARVVEDLTEVRRNEAVYAFIDGLKEQATLERGD